jgi:hypothetical protein
VPTSIQYLEATSVFVALAIYLFVGARWWYGYLTSIADRFDIDECRQRAAMRFPLVALLFVGGLVGAFEGASRLLPKGGGNFILIAFAGSVAPAMIWWVPKMTILQNLGYGRQPRG